MEIELKFEVTGQNSLDAEFRSFQALLASGMKKSLQEVNAEMQKALQKHIETDVYKAYIPSEYERRSDNATLGKPLSDLEANVAFANTPVPLVTDKEIKGQTSFHYLPSGEHSVKRWSSTTPQAYLDKVRLHPPIINVDGDELIRRIETMNPRYNWKRPDLRPRPFWQNFVDEMIDGGKAEEIFVDGMNFYASQLEVEAGGGVERESGDGDY